MASPKYMLEQFKKGLSSTSKFSFEVEGNPSVLKYKGNSFWMYFKNICHAGNPYPPEITRMQMPSHRAFGNIGEEDIFLALAYDEKNDIYICWDPMMVKPRLNKKSNVSLFCKQYVQDNVKMGKVSSAVLSNGDIYALFKTSDIPLFLDNLDHYFPRVSPYQRPPSEYLSSDYSNTNEINTDEGILENVNENEDVRLYIDSNRDKSMSEIVSGVINKWQLQYNHMTFSKWYSIISNYLDEKTNEQ